MRDDGEGFQADEAENIFKRFFMGKKGNTGLGLAITKTIVEKHNGTIEAFNGDAVFVVRLPCKGIK